MERLQNAARRGACLAVILSLVAQAAASDSWWNPFDNSSSDSDQRRPSTAQVSSSKPKSSTSGFPKLPMPSLPKWSLSGSDTDRRSAPKEPSTWDKLNSGTKSFFSKTADFLTPWDNDPEPPPRSRGVTGSRKVVSSKSNHKPQEKSSFSWLSGEEEEPEIKSANDFLKLPRPY